MRKRTVVSTITLLAVALGIGSPGVASADAMPSAGDGPRCPVEKEGSQGDPSQRRLADRRAIEETLAEWADAVRASDLETLGALVTEDAEFWTHGAAPLVGREALIRAFEPFFSTYSMNQDFHCLELIVSGDWAFLRGMESNRLTPKGGGESVVQKQRAFSVLRRQADGKWRFARGMTNLPPKD